MASIYVRICRSLLPIINGEFSKTRSRYKTLCRNGSQGFSQVTFVKKNAVSLIMSYQGKPQTISEEQVLVLFFITLKLFQFKRFRKFLLYLYKYWFNSIFLNVYTENSSKHRNFIQKSNFIVGNYLYQINEVYYQRTV